MIKSETRKDWLLKKPPELSSSSSTAERYLGALRRPDALKKGKFYRAVILESYMKDGPDAEDWNSAPESTDSTPNTDVSRVVACRARIEEINGCMPNPFLEENMVPAATTSIPDNNLIGLHDEFIYPLRVFSEEGNAPALPAGSVILVRYLDSENRIGKVESFLNPGLDYHLAPTSASGVFNAVIATAAEFVAPLVEAVQEKVAAIFGQPQRAPAEAVQGDDGSWQPPEGYKWANPDSEDDYGVVPKDTK